MPEELTPEAKAAIQEILDKAAEDIEFREALLKDPSSVLDPEVSPFAANYTPKLGSHGATLLFSMRRVSLEEQGINVRSSRGFLRDNGASSSRAE